MTHTGEILNEPRKEIITNQNTIPRGHTHPVFTALTNQLSQLSAIPHGTNAFQQADR